MFFVLALTILLFQNSTPDQNTKTSHHEAPRASLSTKRNPAVSNVPHEPLSGPNTYFYSTKEKQNTRNPKPTFWQRPSATDWIIAGLTAVYVTVSIGTLLAIKRQAEIAETARQDFEKQAAATTKQFTDQLGVMQKQLEAMQKAAEHYESLVTENKKQAYSLSNLAAAMYRSAEATEKSATAAEASAGATKKSSDALVAIERSWILARIIDASVVIRPIEVRREDGTWETYSRTSVTVRLYNAGRIPCWIVEKRIQFSLVNIKRVPVEPTFDEYALVDPIIEPLANEADSHWEAENLKAHGEWVVQLIAGETPRDGETVENAPIVYGIIKYRDTFGDNHETRFGYRIRPHGGLKIMASARYNMNA